MRRAPRSGRHWVVAAVGGLLSPLLLYLVVVAGERRRACVRVNGPSSTEIADGVRGPCSTATSLDAVATLGWITVFVVMAVTGLVVGVTEGRRRRTFAHGRWFCAVLLGLSSAWALATYAIGYGLGRIMRPSRDDTAARQGWQSAVSLYARLSDGHPPPTSPSHGFLTSETVHLDTQLGYARFYGKDVTYRQGSTLAIGSPGFVAGALIGRAIGNGIAHAHAANLARAHWREAQPVRVVVTDSSTWCNVRGQWLQFGHATVLEYVLQGPSCILKFSDVAPLRLSGAAVWYHAVLFAHFRDGLGVLEAPQLGPIRDAYRGTARV